MFTANSTAYTSASLAGTNSNDNNTQRGAQSAYTSYTAHNPMMMMQPDMLNAYTAQQAYGGGVYQSVHTPTYDSWGNAVSNQYGSMPGSPAWTTTHANVNNSFHASNTMATSTTSQASNASGEGKKYRHNPYASSEQSTPPASPIMSASHSGLYDATGFGAAMPDPAAPVYDPSVVGDAAMTLPVANSLEDQFNNIVGHIAQTACSARGRTLLLNIIRMQHLDKIQAIFEELCASFSTVISDPQGCHVLRFIVEYLQESHIDLLCNIMTPDLAYDMCTLSQHSRRVLQCLVEHHKTARMQPLIELICANNQAIAIAKTQQGCIAIMRILENVITPLKDMVFHAIAPAFNELAVDQFGNYTVQTAIQVLDRNLLSTTFEKVLSGQFVSVSCNKFGSNVMEKIVHSANASLLRTLMNELCYEPLNLHKLINDGFGNFVIQGIVEVTAGTPEGRRLCETIRPLLQNSPYGHKIEAKLRSKRLLGSVGTESNARSNSTQGASSVSSNSTCGDH